ncbi:hypothetical protein [Stackebrandtia nassauensis]|uniref:DUF4386 domain-containing protein n=1 Tax=Stackebrandtia nassauensis (strain DSM 44728 / CIP 108903 / NRRL B-16338 / NBRC 102104 / LLR-40K-21) TaxID=446470 RepID=D3PYD7_STANL|nr:hypothetical protein [Stackebrandtia nassauensis]ADD41504.1 hypothetical protein Snas_1808 [Stackebrandtia nassauensis DSM 44728]
MSVQSPVTTPPRRLWLLAGFAFPLLFAVSFVFDATTMVGQIPRPGSSAAEVVEFYQANQGVSVYLRAAIRLLSAAALAVVALRFAASPRLRSTPDALRWPTAVVGVVSAVSLAVSPALSIVANATVDTAAPETLLAFREWNYLMGGHVHLAVLGAYAGLLTFACWSRLSLTVRWLGVVTAGSGLAVPLVELANPLARTASWVWLVALTVAVLRSERARV